jgi:hypothetical protein
MDASSVNAFGKVPTVGVIVDIIESGVSPTDYKAMASALAKRGFNPLWAYSPVVGDIYTNHQAGTYKPASSSQASSTTTQAPAGTAGQAGTYKPASSSQASSTTTQAPAGTAGQATQSWLGEMPGVPNALRERESWLNERFGDYIGAQEAANAKYGGVLDSLTGRINDPNSRVSFGLEGADPVSFIPRQTLNEMSAIESLANLTRSNAMRVPTEQWAWSQTNPIHTADMHIFDLMNQLANQEENRRYGIPTQINTASYTQPKPDILTLLTAAGNLTNTGLDIYDKGQSLGFWGQ